MVGRIDIHYMALENYNVEEDDIFISLCSEKNLSKNSKKKYPTV